jgi:DNA-binding beta-propeller fold protein YncE
VSVIDASTNVEVTTLPPVGQHPVGLVATASHVYVAHAGSDIVSVIDLILRTGPACWAGVEVEAVIGHACAGPNEIP